jgi:hypothetical protein
MTKMQQLNSINKFMTEQCGHSLDYEQRIKSLESQLRVEVKNRDHYKALWVHEQNINKGCKE